MNRIRCKNIKKIVVDVKDQVGCENGWNYCEDRYNDYDC